MTQPAAGIQSRTRSSVGANLSARAPAERESLLNLCRTVNLRRPERARNEGTTRPQRLDDTRPARACTMRNRQKGRGLLYKKRAHRVLSCPNRVSCPNPGLHVRAAGPPQDSISGCTQPFRFRARGVNLKGCQGFYLNAKARMWP